MNKIDIALTNLKTALFAEPLVQEYLRVKKLVEEDTFLQETETKLKDLQKAMTQSVGNKVKHEQYKNEYEKLTLAYYDHPYVINYNYLVTEVNNLLQELKMIIE